MEIILDGPDLIQQVLLKEGPEDRLPLLLGLTRQGNMSSTEAGK